jgi:elongation factor Ts
VSISTADVKLLRESTGAGVLDCKKALQETNGNIDGAIEYLRKKGLAAASKKANRGANDGLVSAQISADGKVAVLVKVNCETDFVARTDDFKEFAAALVRQMLAQPALKNADDLLAAPFIDEPGKTVSDRLTEMIAKLGENTIIRQATRFELQGDGMLDSYVHMGGRVGVVLEVGGSKAGNPKFAEMVHDLALQIAAAAPMYVTETEVPAELLASEREIYLAQLADDKKPDNIKERIIDGKVNKWYEDVVLLKQPFVKDSSLTIAQLVAQTGKEIGANLQVRRFARYELGA